ncbi:MAG: hypothetical protein ACK5X3_18000, partial [Pseudomonadota bacterium]
ASAIVVFVLIRNANRSAKERCLEEGFRGVAHTLLSPGVKYPSESARRHVIVDFTFRVAAARRLGYHDAANTMLGKAIFLSLLDDDPESLLRAMNASRAEIVALAGSVEHLISGAAASIDILLTGVTTVADRRRELLHWANNGMHAEEDRDQADSTFAAS